MFKRFGQYLMLLGTVFTKPTKRRLFWRQVSDEIYNLCISSVLIVSIISLFVGAAVTIQMRLNIDSPWMPLYAIGYATRKAIILEFSPTIISLILAGKMGSQIASQLGTMRITEQIDAIEVMGINSANYLILPKIIAALLFNPVLIMLSIVVALIGSWTIGVSVGGMTTYEFLYGMQFEPENFDLAYALIKTVFFAFLIASISSFQGYYVQGGALEVGKASTKAVVHSSIAIILSNLLLTQLLIS
ncbi:MAG: ABC transporter permease [Bacteroidales bacterium]|nr:ABC transporter permease [Bacteroidales bacterium]MDE7090709.1 ABC transporter permease [Bacteroidales bacterium]MDE7102655.1 ABC transporter permease [Bacteroidales bacterium]